MAAVFPFSAIVGQDEMKLALLIASVDPSVGGVLIFGDRGTGKSTAVRALAALLPTMRAVVGCPYGCDPAKVAGLCGACDVPAAGKPAAAAKSRTAAAAKPAAEPKSHAVPVPVVDLPLGATEDRVVGALDLEQALTRGEKRFEPGLLAKAHRGFLYIDEVNLLEDHLVDLLLDVAASGENVVEREGLSVRHPARFVLIGTGNPEEGELRPQLLDRFGLSVDVKTPTVLADRVAVVRQRDAFDRDPETFAAAWTKKDAQVRDRIVKARALHSNLALPDEVVECAATLCMKIGSDGLRGELTLIRAARALAALEGAKAVSTTHLREIAVMSLQHRLRRNPLDDVGSASRIERALGEIFAP
jgi:magnesium chelatase subunit I